MNSRILWIGLLAGIKTRPTGRFRKPKKQTMVDGYSPLCVLRSKDQMPTSDKWLAFRRGGDLVTVNLSGLGWARNSQRVLSIIGVSGAWATGGSEESAIKALKEKEG